MIIGMIAGAILIVMFLYIILEDWVKMGIADKLIMLIMLVAYILSEIYIISGYVVSEFFNCLLP